jgi:outer membrane receptor for ferric coprogen and ferric-rhodotorulic acid
MIRKNPIFFVKNSEHNEVICASTLPKQYKETINTLHVGGLAGICLFDNYHFDVDIVKSIIGEETKKIVNNVPEWNMNARLYYMSDFYDHRASLVVGTALNWYTPYFGDGYDPVVQQFYTQNFFEQWSYPLWDIYLNFRINKFRAFLKVTNLLQYAYNECPHYFASPFYPGQGRTFDFGVSWSIFD